MLAWLAPAVAEAARNGFGLATLLPAVLLACSLAGLLGAVPALARRGDAAAGRGGAGLAGTLAVVFVVTWLALLALMLPAPRQRLPAGTLEIQARNLAYQPAVLEARAGRITVALRNHDLFWHTFSSSSLGVNLRVPVSAVRTVTFQARPGRYAFACRIPTHAAAGMRGTLVVR